MKDETITTATEALDAVRERLRVEDTNTPDIHRRAGLAVAKGVVEQVRERVTDPEPCDCDERVRAARVEELETLREVLRNGSPPLMSHVNACLRELIPAPEWDEQWRALGWRPIEELDIDDSSPVIVLIRRNTDPHEKASPYTLEARYDTTPQNAAQLSGAVGWMHSPVVPRGVDR